MYTYKQAIGINRLTPRGEELLDISSIQTRTLYSLFDNLRIIITDTLIERDVLLDSTAYQNDLVGFNGTIQQWLDTKATVALKVSNTIPGLEYRFVTTHDIQYRGFSLRPGDVNRGDDAQDLLTAGQAPDIRVVRTDNTDVDWDKLLSRSLWVMNGHLVKAVKGTRCLYLLGAGKHFNVDDNIHVNCLNFNTVSSLKTHDIKEEAIKFENKDTYRFLHVKSPVSLKGKTVWMSIGGRLYLNDVVQANSENSVSIRTEKVDWFSAIFDSKKLIDLSSVIDKDRNTTDGQFFNTESFFKKLLTDKSSFFIILDNPYLYTSLEPLTTYQYPFTYHTEETRPIPLITGHGLIPKYFTRKIINRRLLDIDIGIQKLYVNKTTGLHNEGGLYHDATNRFSPSRLSKGYHLYIRGLIQE